MSAGIQPVSGNAIKVSTPRKMLIAGKWVSAASGKSFPVLNPATEEEIAHVPEGDRDDVSH